MCNDVDPGGEEGGGWLGGKLRTMSIAAPAPADTLLTPPKPLAPPTPLSSTPQSVFCRRTRFHRRKASPYEKDASVSCSGGGDGGGELMTPSGRMLSSGDSSTTTTAFSTTAFSTTTFSTTTADSYSCSDDAADVFSSAAKNTPRWRSSGRRRRGSQDRLGSPPLGEAKRKSTSFSSRVVAILLLGVVSYVAGEQCDIKPCSDETLVDNPFEGKTLPYCLALHKYKECLTELKRHCFSVLSYRAGLQISETKYSEYNCEEVLKNGEGPSASLASSSNSPAFDPSICSYNGSPAVSHCWLFGDPHLRTFKGEVMTCRVKGAWPLVDNNHIAIQVTNEAVPPQMIATATTKVTVIIRRLVPCSPERTYEASAESLPKAFVDGTTRTGLSKTDPIVYVEEVVSGSHVVIHARHVNTTVTIRRVAGYLTVLAILPKELAQEAADGIELCGRGCDEEERVRAPNQPEMPWAEAERKCREYNLTAHYLDACVFDLITTGQEDFRLPAHHALRDVWLLDPEGARALSNRTSAIISSSAAAGGRSRAPPLTLLITSLLAAATWGGTQASWGQSRAMTSLWVVTSLVALMAGGSR
ncbi:repulsive guidance molecule A-like isoform X2 [Oratosquilla oratoria]|uniref:repulsive guidance molecule A-like isoform X2 n=1 Tax=Oratosquilla oratoria TaxID=337810 RepID=UPI003F76D309